MSFLPFGLVTQAVMLDIFPAVRAMSPSVTVVVPNCGSLPLHFTAVCCTLLTLHSMTAAVMVSVP